MKETMFYSRVGCVFVLMMIGVYWIWKIPMKWCLEILDVGLLAVILLVIIVEWTIICLAIAIGALLYTIEKIRRHRQTKGSG